MDEHTRKKIQFLRRKKTEEERLGILSRERRKLDKEIRKCYNEIRNRENPEGVIMDKKDFESAFSELSSKELSEVLEIGNQLLKEKKNQEKQEKEELFREKVGVGDTVRFFYKGEEYEGEVEKINNSTFTANFEYDGFPIRKPIRFHLFTQKVEDSGEDSVEEAV